MMGSADVPPVGLGILPNPRDSNAQQRVHGKVQPPTATQTVIYSSKRLHDLFLQGLLQIVGPKVAVMLVSDHGFHSDQLQRSYWQSRGLGK